MEHEFDENCGGIQFEELVDPDVEEDEEDMEPEETDEEIEWDDYDGYPFAMETWNGEVLSMTAAFKRQVIQKILSACSVTEQELAAYLQARGAGEEHPDRRLRLLDGHDCELLTDVLDFCPEEGTFALTDIGMLRYSDGWGIKELLEDLRFPVKELIHYGPHGHGTNGVCYIE